VKATSDGPPAGWVSITGVLAPGVSVAAYAARQQPVKAVCRTKGCYRRLDLDPTELCGERLGPFPMEKIKRLYECRRWNGCGLDFHDEPAQRKLRLEEFTGRPNVRLRLRCRSGSCKFFRVWLVEEMIEALRKRKAGSGATEIEGLGKMMTTACPLCKKVNWLAEILWANMNTVGWKQLGERSFNHMEPG